MSQPINHLVIVGRDAPLWLAASTLARALAPSSLTVTAVELPSKATSADLHASLPALEALHKQLRLDERRLLSAVGGAYTLGWNFADAGGAVAPFLHPFGAFGSPIAGQDFFPHWLRARRHGLSVPLEDFSLTAAAARQGRLFIPDTESERYGRSDYGYHLPALAYAGVLKDVARQAGVTILSAASLSPVRDGETGLINALALEDGRRVEGDFFLDVTGPDALLIGGPGNGMTSWAFPADRVLTARGPRLTSIPTYAEVRGFADGWLALRPAQAGTFITAVWKSGPGEGDVLRRLPSLCGFAPQDAIVRSSSPGLRARAWDGNCVALGSAAVRLDPLHDLDLLSVQQGLVHLLAHFPRTMRLNAAQAEYNRVTAGHFTHLRDFQALHYHLARHPGAFWDAARALPLSDDLFHRVALFRARGELAPWEEDDLAPDSWRAFLAGHGLLPDSHPPGVDLLPPDDLKAHLRHMLGFVKNQVLRQPVHDAYLRGG
ncbi:tryptophan 7-halogenase [Niveispirillum sp. KHB5.9]|uniref:tryptophan 7-halogenase n=1 Tax=Niveispirillum sp. KHB5.9 TaxID=3400269 RepID=UPI003A85DC63